MRKLFALVALAVATVASASTLPLSELQIGGIASGTSETNLTQQLGEPLQRVETGEGTEFRYPGLVITVGWLEQAAPGRERRVTALLGTGPRACTPRGLCPGMPVAAASRLYGPPQMAIRETGTFLEYYPDEPGCWLQVADDAGTIRSVAVACMP
jgi:hypothetical protein